MTVAIARGARRAVRERLARPNQEPVIVLGKEKSGTTVIAEHTARSVTLDIPALFGSRIGPIRSGEPTRSAGRSRRPGAGRARASARRLAAHFERPGVLDLHAGSYIELLAKRWNLAADVYLEHRDEMRLIKYEDFVADKAGSIAAAAEALGLPGRRDVSHMVDRQYQRRGMRGVKWQDFFGERNLRLIEDTCAELMSKLGYQ
jgi:hypothetical protein